MSSFKEEVLKLSKNGDVLRKSEEVWKTIRKALKKFAKKTGERGCNVFFENVSDEVIGNLKWLASKDDIEFMNWEPGEPGHPGKRFEQFGIINWDSSWYFSKYPFKVSIFSLTVSEHKNIIKAEIFDTKGKTVCSKKSNNRKKKNA